MKNKRCYAKISINNLLHNFACIKDLLPDGCDMIPIIKANAYSHGSVEFARALSSSVSTFAVAEMDEALTLRANGIKNDILILGYTDPAFATVLADSNIIQSVMSLDYARELYKRLGGLSLKVHIKVDTGMHRFGFNSESEKTADEIAEISRLQGLEIAGIFSHFAESDDPSSDFTELQFSRFTALLEKLKKVGVDTGTAHIANSSATLIRSHMLMDAVRPGIILYGAYPSKEIKKAYLTEHPDMPLREVMTLCAKVGQVMEVKKGESTGYGRNHTFERDSRIATVTAGYADGIPRALSNKGRVKIKGEIFNIVGNICMDLLMVDITDARVDISAGDEVTFWGSDGIAIDEYAELAGTINYELYTGISPRVTKIYE